MAKDYGYEPSALREGVNEERNVSILRVELFYDDEAANWHYRVPALGIDGGRYPARADAEADCLAAVSFALEGDPQDYDAEADVVRFEVSIAPAA